MASAIATAVASIRERFRTQVSVPQSLPTIHDNAPNAALPGVGRYCRFLVQLGEQTQQTLSANGGGHWRTVGTAVAAVYQPVGDGDGWQIELADTIVDAFRGQTIVGPPLVRFDALSIEGEPTLDDGMWLVIVSIPFLIEEYV
jgi:hypothetical protein